MSKKTLMAWSDTELRVRHVDVDDDEAGTMVAQMQIEMGLPIETLHEENRWSVAEGWLSVTHESRTLTAKSDDVNPFVDYEPSKPYWQCQECGHESHTKPMPANRDDFYGRAFPPKCPKCKSEAFQPVGW